MIWCLGAGLFAHAVTSLSVSYTDQSMMFFWLNIGVISSMYSVVAAAWVAEKDALGAAPLAARQALRPAARLHPQSARPQHTNAGRHLRPRRSFD